jgi:hypothetical protein
MKPESFFRAMKMPSMLREYAQLMRPAADISLEKHVQLLKMTFDRILYSFLVIPFTAVFAALLYGSEHDATLMNVWALVYCGVFFYRIRLQRLFEEDLKHLQSAQLLAHWLPKLKNTVMLHGLGHLVFDTCRRYSDQCHTTNGSSQRVCQVFECCRFYLVCFFDHRISQALVLHHANIHFLCYWFLSLCVGGA